MATVKERLLEVVHNLEERELLSNVEASGIEDKIDAGNLRDARIALEVHLQSLATAGAITEKEQTTFLHKIVAGL